jgi:hypothetical protein
MPKTVSLMLMSLICGCASNHMQRTDLARQQITISLEPAIRMSSATPYAKLQTDDGDVQLGTKLQLARGGTIYFGAINTYDEDENVNSSIPIIARLNDGKWKMLRIDDKRLHDADWSYVAAGPHRGEIWGMLDRTLDAKQPDLLIAHSTDGGSMFTLTALHKPNEVADFDSFCLGPDGNGRLTLYASGADESVDRPGFYHYRTTDGGRTWTGPSYEADAMSPGEDVPDEEQPDAKSKSVKPALARPVGPAHQLVSRSNTVGGAHPAE